MSFLLPVLIVVVIGVLFSVFRNRGGRPPEIDRRPSDSGEGGSYPFFADTGISGHGHHHHSHDSGPPCDSGGWDSGADSGGGGSSGAGDCGGGDGGGGSGGGGAGE